MAKKKKLLKIKKKGGLSTLFILLLGFLVLSLAIPLIGYNESSPALWIDVVEFFEAAKLHFQSFWMFYTFGLALLLTQFKK